MGLGMSSQYTPMMRHTLHAHKNPHAHSVVHVAMTDTVARQRLHGDGRQEQSCVAALQNTTQHND
eukprot:m.596740 g.596740  ORF g.596740 m.596740 type:complete len:65 (+) comp22415_c0_seq4:1030-1224(+)